MEMHRRTFAEINLDNLIHNFRLIKRELPQAPFICPMIKANAYGHGDVEVAKALVEAGATSLGVCLIEEGLLCRKNQIKSEILVFRGFDKVGAKVIIENSLTPVVSAFEHLEYLENLASKPVSVHIKFNTGMNRLGFNSADAEKIRSFLRNSRKLQVTGLLTHLLDGEDSLVESGRSYQQLTEFQKVSEVFSEFSPRLHALNSSGIIANIKVKNQSDHYLTKLNFGLRPGLMIYGYNPLQKEISLDLRPVMSFKSTASQLRKIQAGETVSYSGTWTARRDSILAVVPVGYADGYHRILSNKAAALFGGSPVPVVGNVTMDYLMLDVTDVVQNEDLQQFKDQEVVLFGNDERGQFLSAEKLAHHAQSITWEILTSVGERVPRVFRKGGE